MALRAAGKSGVIGSVSAGKVGTWQPVCWPLQADVQLSCQTTSDSCRWSHDLALAVGAATWLSWVTLVLFDTRMHSLL